MAKREAEAKLTIPDGWGLTQAVLHYEGEDLSMDPDPFAGNVVVQLRLDVEPEDELEAVSRRDQDDLKKAFGAFQAKKPSAQSGRPVLEFSFEDRDGRKLQQIVLYGRRGDHVYTVTGTHVPGARFETVRSTAVDLARVMLDA